MKQAGFTLIEIMVVISISLILLTTALPSLMGMIKNSRLVTLHNELVSDLSLTRSTAVNSGGNAIICAANVSADQCLGEGTDWIHGWLVFGDADDDGRVDADEVIISVKAGLNADVKLVSSRIRVRYSADGTALGYPAAFIFCDSRESSTKRGLILTDSGNTQIVDTNQTGLNCS